VDTTLVGYDDQGRPNSVRYTSIIPLLIDAFKDLGTTVASFAEKVTTKELTFDRAFGHELTVDKLCVGAVCVTESQFLSVFGASASSQTASAAGAPVPGNTEAPAGSPMPTEDTGAATTTTSSEPEPTATAANGNHPTDNTLLVDAPGAPDPAPEAPSPIEFPATGSG
jgi:hypothetical protein